MKSWSPEFKDWALNAPINLSFKEYLDMKKQKETFPETLPNYKDAKDIDISLNAAEVKRLEKLRNKPEIENTGKAYKDWWMERNPHNVQPTKYEGVTKGPEYPSKGPEYAKLYSSVPMSEEGPSIPMDLVYNIGDMGKVTKGLTTRIEEIEEKLGEEIRAKGKKYGGMTIKEVNDLPLYNNSTKKYITKKLVAPKEATHLISGKSQGLEPTKKDYVLSPETIKKMEGLFQGKDSLGSARRQEEAARVKKMTEEWKNGGIHTGNARPNRTFWAGESPKHVTEPKAKLKDVELDD